MTAPRSDADTPAGGSEGSTPAVDLGDLWKLLDRLPTVETPEHLLATTIEMVAVNADGSVGSRGGGHGRPPAASGSEWWKKLWPAGVVVLAMACGMLLGRAMAPDPDRPLLEQLPIIRQIELLQEAGSIDFLEAFPRDRFEAVFEREQMSRWLAARAGIADLDAESARFATELASLEELARPGVISGDELARRREQIEAMSPEELLRLEQSFQTYKGLSSGGRRSLVALARALADPERPQLAAAAGWWHLWLEFQDPADRSDVIAMPAEDRLKYIDRQFVQRMRTFGERPEGRGGFGPPGERDSGRRPGRPSEAMRPGDGFPRPPFPNRFPGGPPPQPEGPAGELRPGRLLPPRGGPASPRPPADQTPETPAPPD